MLLSRAAIGGMALVVAVSLAACDEDDGPDRRQRATVRASGDERAHRTDDDSDGSGA